MEDSSPRLVYNPNESSVMLQTSGPAVTVDGLEGDITFEMITPEGESALALWLDPNQADVLVKMVGYILAKVRITESSKETLAQILPQLEALLERHRAG